MGFPFLQPPPFFFFSISAPVPTMCLIPQHSPPVSSRLYTSRLQKTDSLQLALTGLGTFLLLPAFCCFHPLHVYLPSEVLASIEQWFNKIPEYPTSGITCLVRHSTRDRSQLCKATSLYQIPYFGDEIDDTDIAPASSTFLVKS